MMNTNSRYVLSVAGSDPSGGAGVQLDQRVFERLGVQGVSVITAHTVQTARGVRAVHAATLQIFRDQLLALLEDMPIAAIKVGMLYSEEIAACLADCLKNAAHIPLVIDPIIRSTSGAELLSAEGCEALKTNLFPRATLITPNIPEAEYFSGERISAAAPAENVALALLALGPRAVLLKGGHIENDRCDDMLVQRTVDGGHESLHLPAPRVGTANTRGTGCALSAAIAANLAQGRDLREAVVRAKGFLFQELQKQPALATPSACCVGTRLECDLT